MKEIDSEKGRELQEVWKHYLLKEIDSEKGRELQEVWIYHCWRQLTVERGRRHHLLRIIAQKKKAASEREIVDTPISVKIVQEEVKMVTPEKR